MKELGVIIVIIGAIIIGTVIVGIAMKVLLPIAGFIFSAYCVLEIIKALGNGNKKQ